MNTAEQYKDSLRARKIELWIDGVRVEEPLSNPKVEPAVEAVAATYALAHDPAHHGIATAFSDLTSRPVNRFVHLFRSPDDLVKKVMLQRELGRITGTCFQRCVGMDALNALFIATFDAGDVPHARFVRWLREVQQRDEMVCGAMTDAKGDRRKRPAEQPDSFVRIVERRPDGVVIRGVKVHQTGAANAHQILVMPGQALRTGEEAFAIACAVPVDAPGVVMILGRQPSDDRKGTPDAGNVRYAGQQVVVAFDDVFVPSANVFLDGHLAAVSALLEAFTGFHRASYGGCKPGNLDALIGAVAEVARLNGVERTPAARDKMIEMVHLTETVHGLGLAASHKSTRHAAGVWRVDALLANVCTQNVSRLPYEVARLAEDLAGGLVSTMPSLADAVHPRLGPILANVMGSEERGKMLRLVEWFTSGVGSVPLRIECMHGAGSPMAQRMVIDRHADWAGKVRVARRLAGLPDV